MSPRAAGARAVAVAPADPDRTFAIVTTADPTRFYPRFGILPAVRAVRGQTGDWDAPGRTRTLELSDGGTVVERLTTVESPRFFAYTLTEFTGLFGRLVESARSEWRFEPSGAHTAIDWRYAFTARRGRGPIVAAIVRLAWGPYMRRVLPGLVDEVRRVR
jgi:hypothetical protein